MKTIAFRPRCVHAQLIRSKGYSASRSTMDPPRADRMFGIASETEAPMMTEISSFFIRYRRNPIDLASDIGFGPWFD